MDNRKNTALSAPLRPGSIDVRGQQTTLFPFDAFEFDDPNRVLEPLLTLKSPWKFYLNDGAILAFNGEGTPQDPQVGDTYLKITDQGLVWYEQTSSGPVEIFRVAGTDYYGNTIKYIKTAAIVPLGFETEIPTVSNISELLPSYPSLGMFFYYATFQDYYGTSTVTKSGTAAMTPSIEYTAENKKRPESAYTPFYAPYSGVACVCDSSSAGAVGCAVGAGLRIITGFRFWTNREVLTQVFEHGTSTYGFDVEVSNSSFDIVIRSPSGTSKLSDSTTINRTFDSTEVSHYITIAADYKYLDLGTKWRFYINIDGRQLEPVTYDGSAAFTISNITYYTKYDTDGFLWVGDAFHYGNLLSTISVFTDDILEQFSNHFFSGVPWSYLTTKNDVLIEPYDSGKIKLNGDTEIDGDLTISGTISGTFNTLEIFPIGGLAPFPYTSVPTGWLKADGSLVDPADYPDLFDLYGTTFGGNGTTTFGLPNLSGIGLSGSGTRTINGRTKGDATAVGGLREDQDQLLTGQFYAQGNPSGPGDTSGTGPFGLVNRNIVNSSSSSASTYEALRDFDNSRSIRTGTYSRGPSMVVTWCVKARHVLVDAYDDANIDQRLSDIEDGTTFPFEPGHIYGLETRAGTDSDHDVIISVGKCRSKDDLYNIVRTSELTKRIDAAWAVGSGAGGLFSGTVAANTTYHLFVIRKDSDGSVDAGWGTSASAPSLPTGYTGLRRIRSYVTNASANLIQTTQDGDDFWYNARVLDVDVANMANAEITHNLTLPTNVTKAYLSMITYDGGQQSILVYCSPETGFTPVQASAAGVAGDVTSFASTTATANGTSVSAKKRVINATIKTRTTTASTINRFKIITLGWEDSRGRFGEV